MAFVQFKLNSERSMVTSSKKIRIYILAARRCTTHFCIRFASFIRHSYQTSSDNQYILAEFVSTMKKKKIPPLHLERKKLKK